jgi:hypothetical protein
MADNGRIRPATADWCDEEQYLHLLELDRAGWAWEWLRRNPDYVEGEGREASMQLSQEARTRPTILSGVPMGDASRWGLCFCRSGELLSRTRAHALECQHRRIGCPGGRASGLTRA